MKIAHRFIGGIGNTPCAQSVKRTADSLTVAIGRFSIVRFTDVQCLTRVLWDKASCKDTNIDTSPPREASLLPLNSSLCKSLGNLAPNVAKQLTSQLNSYRLSALAYKGWVSEPAICRKLPSTSPRCFVTVGSQESSISSENLSGFAHSSARLTWRIVISDRS
jgi:hypothetical protein